MDDKKDSENEFFIYKMAMDFSVPTMGKAYPSEKATLETLEPSASSYGNFGYPSFPAYSI